MIEIYSHSFSLRVMRISQDAASVVDFQGLTVTFRFFPSHAFVYFLPKLNDLALFSDSKSI